MQISAMLSSWVRANMPVSGHEPAGAQNSEPMSTGRASMHACMDVDVDTGTLHSACRACIWAGFGQGRQTSLLVWLAARGAREASLWAAAAQHVERRPGKRMCGGVRCQRDRAAQLGDGAMCGARPRVQVRADACVMTTS